MTITLQAFTFDGSFDGPAMTMTLMKTCSRRGWLCRAEDGEAYWHCPGRFRRTDNKTKGS